MPDRSPDRTAAASTRYSKMREGKQASEQIGAAPEEAGAAPSRSTARVVKTVEGLPPEVLAAQDRAFVAATEVAKKEHSRIFEITDELATLSLSQWSDPVQLRLQIRDDFTYDLLARRL